MRCDPWLHLIDELIERAQPNGTFQLCTPATPDRSQALAQTTTKEGILLQIHPQPLKFLQNAKPTHHIMMTALTLQHGNGQLLDMSPFGLHSPSVMAVSCELIGILASTMPTLPVTLARLLPHGAPTAFFASQLGRYLRFQKGHDDLLGGLYHGFFDLLLDGLKDFFTGFPDDSVDGNGYTHKC